MVYARANRCRRGEKNDVNRPADERGRRNIGAENGGEWRRVESVQRSVSCAEISAVGAGAKEVKRWSIRGSATCFTDTANRTAREILDRYNPTTKYRRCGQTGQRIPGMPRPTSCRSL